ncbi:hypothetical protein CR513_36374, partial [Mucuna pruriens]
MAAPVQSNCHVISRGAWSASLPSTFQSLTPILYTHDGAWCFQQYFSQLRKCRSKIEKLKIIKGDRLDYQRTLVGPILNVLANRGNPSPFDHAIVVEDGSPEFTPYHFAETMSDKSLSEATRPPTEIDVNLFLLCMTRSGPNNLHAYDPEIDRTFYMLRNSRSNEVVNSNNHNCSVFVSDSISSSFASDSTSSTCASDPATNADSSYALGSSSACSDSNFGVSLSQFGKDNIENNDSTLKELATPYLSYELKSGLIHLLPKFHGLTGEDPYKHLKEFHVVCSTMRPNGIPKNYIKMKAFCFSLDGAAKDWLYL